MAKRLATAKSNYTPFEQPTPQNVDHVKGDHDKLVSDEGYDILFEKSVKCPCKQLDRNKTHTTCVNCNGSGWVFVNATTTKSLILSQSKQLKFGLQGEVLNSGQISVTPLSGIVMSENDRITLLDSVGVVSEQPRPYLSDTGQVILKFNYIIKSVETLFKFISTSLPLQRIEEEDYEIDGNTLKLNADKFKTSDITFSSRYFYNPQYIIVDVAKHVRNIHLRDELGTLNQTVYPQLCIARLAHYTFNQDENNIDNG